MGIYTIYVISWNSFYWNKMLSPFKSDWIWNCPYHALNRMYWIREKSYMKAAKGRCMLYRTWIHMTNLSCNVNNLNIFLFSSENISLYFLTHNKMLAILSTKYRKRIVYLTKLIVFELVQKSSIQQVVNIHKMCGNGKKSIWIKLLELAS